MRTKRPARLLSSSWSSARMEKCWAKPCRNLASRIRLVVSSIWAQFLPPRSIRETTRYASYCSKERKMRKSPYPSKCNRLKQWTSREACLRRQPHFAAAGLDAAISTPDRQTTLKSKAEDVLLDVVVRHKKGRLVRGLKSRQFPD